MTPPLRRYLLVTAGILLLLLTSILLLASYRLGGSAYLWFKLEEFLHSATSDKTAIWLPDYQVVVEARQIEGLEGLSALTYDPDRDTLFSVTNKNPHLVELSLEGHLLRRIPLIGFNDPEAIEYVSTGSYLISDEHNQRLVKIRLSDDTSSIDAAEFQQLSLRIDLSNNKGFEGLAYDHDAKRIFVAKERNPVRIYEIQGFPHIDPAKPLALDVRENPQHNTSLFVRDISSLQFDQNSNHLLILSDESHVLLELSEEGEAISSLSLLAGQHGLKRMIMQAEGVAMDEKGSLYIISEPNLFYVFRKP